MTRTRILELSRRERQIMDAVVSTSQLNGLMTFTPAFLKSDTLRVTTLRPWTSAVAATKLSLIGMA